ARMGANKLLMMLIGSLTPLGPVTPAGTRIVPNAKGGVYDVPGLSAFSNQIVSKPTIVPFARGGVLFGEAGSEAIMPLKRTQGGQLGVVATGGGATQVVINNHTGAAVSQRRETGRGPNGEDLERIIVEIGARNIANGG